MTGKLIANGFTIDTMRGMPMPFNYSVADMKRPHKRKRNYSHELELPGTAANMLFFSSTYRLDLSTVSGTSLAGFTYDPTTRVSAKYEKRGQVVFDGLMQLLRVKKKGKDFTFIVNMFSNYTELYQSLGETKVSELGWAEYDHILNRTNVKNSWATSVMLNGVATANFSAGVPLGWGYHYGLVDYGYGRPGPKVFSTSDLVPMVYKREVMYKIFQRAGINWTSAFLDSARFKRQLLGFGGGPKVSIPPAEASNRRVAFSGDFSQTFDTPGSTFMQNNVLKGHFVVNRRINALQSSQGLTPSVLTDPYVQYSSTTGLVTIEKSGAYKLIFNQTLLADVDPGTMTYDSGSGSIRLDILRNGSIVGSAVSGAQEMENVSLVANRELPLTLQAGDVLEVVYNISAYLNYTLTGGAETIEPLSLSVTDTSNLAFDLVSIEAPLGDGNTVELARFIPDMKATDFLTGIITANNLYISDPDAEGNVVIEPLTDFYLPTTQFDDWSQLVDHSQEIIIKPAASIEGKRYVFKFTEDGDYDNKKYRETFDHGYGDYIYTVESTWQKGDIEYKLPFAQTVPTDQLTPLVVPRIITYNEQNGAVTPFKGKPRIYFWNGLKSGGWRLTNVAYDAGNGSTYEDLTSYPCVHHFDNWQMPTFDLNFGLPEQLQYITSVVTNNNFFTAQHRAFVREITGKDSKIVELSVMLSARQIAKMQFNKLKMINGVLFRLNEINDYDAENDVPCRVELTKVIEARSPKSFTALPGPKKPHKGATPLFSPGPLLPATPVPGVSVLHGGKPGVGTTNKNKMIG